MPEQEPPTPSLLERQYELVVPRGVPLNVELEGQEINQALGELSREAADRLLPAGSRATLIEYFRAQIEKNGGSRIKGVELEESAELAIHFYQPDNGGIVIAPPNHPPIKVSKVRFDSIFWTPTFFASSIHDKHNFSLDPFSHLVTDLAILEWGEEDNSFKCTQLDAYLDIKAGLTVARDSLSRKDERLPMTVKCYRQLDLKLSSSDFIGLMKQKNRTRRFLRPH